MIGAVGGKNGADKMKILFVGQSDFAALGLCAEGEKKQLILQDLSLIHIWASRSAGVFL